MSLPSPATAYQDYFLLAALASLVAILPALPLQECWGAMRRRVGLGQRWRWPVWRRLTGRAWTTAVRAHEVSQP